MSEKNKTVTNGSVLEGDRRSSESTLEKSSRPDPEVSSSLRRRYLTAKQKLKFLEQIDACAGPGEKGAFMRRNGLYSSTVSGWRRQREEGELQGLASQKRGRKSIPKDHRDKKIKKLEKENRKLQQELERAALIIDVQKKVSMLLGVPLRSQENNEND